MAETNKCYLLEPEPRIVGQMGAFIASIASKRKGIVFLDTDIIPYLSHSELEEATKDTVEPIIEFNSTLINKVLGHKADKVVITREIQDEMYADLESALGEIGRVAWPKKHHERLAKVYVTLRDSIGSRQLPPYESTPVFQACYQIAQKVLEYFPKLKKNLTRAKATDEKLIAHAIAQAIETENAVAIFSNEITVANMAREVYKLLVARNLGGDTQGCNLWTPKRLEAHPVEVWGYGLKDGSDKKLFIEKFAKKFFATGFKWAPPQEASSSDSLGREKRLRKQVWEEMAVIEEALGNVKEADKFLAKITGTYQEPEPEKTGNGDEHPPAAGSSAPAKPSQKNGSRTDITQGSKKRERNLETVLFGLVPEDTDNLPQDRIDTTLRRYRALKALARELELPLDGINRQIARIEGKSRPVIIKNLTSETEDLVRKRNVITADINYFRNPRKREEVESIEAQIKENAQRLQELERTEIKTEVARQTVTFQSNERDFYERLKKEGYDPDTPEGVLVPMADLQKIGRYKSAASLSIKLCRLENAGKITRERIGKGKAVKVTLNNLPLLVKGAKA
ncbi:hypothetical protein KY310_04670 [Candidatus Woesearchaeota archaeon]|nr:hypothetical protein [Candidatus Woesearchaeota archaeon]